MRAPTVLNNAFRYIVRYVARAIVTNPLKRMLLRLKKAFIRAAIHGQILEGKELDEGGRNL